MRNVRKHLTYLLLFSGIFAIAISWTYFRKAHRIRQQLIEKTQSYGPRLGEKVGEGTFVGGSIIVSGSTNTDGELDEFIQQHEQMAKQIIRHEHTGRLLIIGGPMLLIAGIILRAKREGR